ncbi:MAG TPA: hypothetical protein VMP01_18725 [Pirellulaceae bacterium]|nr:hypothetical protein [Pirellulaceae bacterium]
MAVRAARWLILVLGWMLFGQGSLASPARAQEKEQPLPLKRVVLFSSSVGFFEHGGQIVGNQQVEFSFKTADINDLLKSMVVQDRDGGLIKAVNYGSPEPLTRTLRTLAVDLTDSPTLAEIFQQLRGQEVELKTPQLLTGIIVGVEVRQLPRGEDKVAEVEVLHVRTKDGLQSVRLESIEQTRFLSEKVDREFQLALELLAGERAADLKTVKLDCQGAGKRNVAVGYIQEAAVWKTSYRLVLSDGKQPFLQGWAIVENTSLQDWNDVELTLVSGRPISFVMDLYQPLFMSRPLVTPERHASLMPRTYDQDLAARDGEFAEAGRVAGRRSRQDSGGALGGGGLFGGGGFGGGEGGDPQRPNVISVIPVQDAMDLKQGVQSAAAGQDVGELFRYAIKTPVTLPRNESAMLPIVNEEVQGEKVAIYNPSVHAKHPLSGLKLTNSTDLHLLQGPITLFDGNEYAGDARIEDVPPGSTRLVSYALDLETEIVSEVKPEQQTIVALSVSKGGLHIKQKGMKSAHYTIKNSGSKTKTVLIERPVDPAWTIVSPEPAEKTRSLYRFAAKAEPGQPESLVIAQERDLAETLLLANVGTADIEIYLRAAAASPALKKVFEELIRRKSALAALAEQRDLIERHIATLASDQERVRQNLRALNGLVTQGSNKTTSGELTQRYLKMLADTEDELAKEWTRAADVGQQEAKANKELEKYLAEVVVE